MNGHSPRAVLFDFDGTLGKYVSHLGLYVRRRGGVPRPHHRGGARRGARPGLAALETPKASITRRTPATQTPSARSRALHVREASRRRARLAISRPLRNASATSKADATHIALYDDTLPALERAARSEGARRRRLQPCIGRCRTSSGRSHRRPPFAGAHERACRLPQATSQDSTPRPSRPAPCPPAALLFVGDNYEQDVLGPQAAGMRAVLLTVRAPGPTPTPFARSWRCRCACLGLVKVLGARGSKISSRCRGLLRRAEQYDSIPLPSRVAGGAAPSMLANGEDEEWLWIKSTATTAGFIIRAYYRRDDSFPPLDADDCSAPVLRAGLRQARALTEPRRRPQWSGTGGASRRK